MLRDFAHTKTIWLTGFVLLVLLLLSYQRIFGLWYQQDEWLTLGIFFSGGIDSYFRAFTALQTLSGTSRALSVMFQYPLYILFPFQEWPFAAFSLVFHFMNALLVYVFAYSLKREKLFAFLAAVFFICNSVSSQAVTWVAASTTTLPSASFFLVSLILALTAARKKKLSLFFWSQAAAITSFLYKESGIMAFILSPYLYFIWGGQYRKFRSTLTQLTPLIGYGLFIAGSLIYRVLRSPVIPNSGLTEQSALVWQKAAFHVLLYPTISLSQVFIPRQILFSLAKIFQSINYGSLERFTATQLGVESIVSDFLSFVLSAAIAAVAVSASSVKPYRKVILFSLVFTVISFLPFVLLEKSNAYLDSRYFYMGAIGGGLLLSALLSGIAQWVRSLNKKLFPIALILAGVCSGLFIGKHVQYIRRDINVAVIESSERISFFTQLAHIIPNLPARSVLYVTGNNFGYYGRPEIKIPFQQGPGYTFMVWFFRDHTIPAQLLRNYFLWRVEEQGYTEIGDAAFGYFYDLNALHGYVQDKKVTPSQVIGLYYDTGSKKLTDITVEIRRQLEE